LRDHVEAIEAVLNLLLSKSCLNHWLWSIVEKIYRKVIPKLRFDNVGMNKKIIWFLEEITKNIKRKGILEVKL
jgi:hypothetical protein